MWAEKGIGRLIKLVALSLGCQYVFRNSTRQVLFTTVFVVVYLADNLHRFLPSGKKQPMFLEEVLAGVALYGGLGLAAYWLEAQITVYTQGQVGPVVPAILVALMDRCWKPPRRRRRW